MISRTRFGTPIGRRFQAFLAGAFFFSEKHAIRSTVSGIPGRGLFFLEKHVPFQKARVFSVLGSPSKKKVLKYAQASAGSGASASLSRLLLVGCFFQKKHVPGFVDPVWGKNNIVRNKKGADTHQKLGTQSMSP